MLINTERSRRKLEEAIYAKYKALGKEASQDELVRYLILAASTAGLLEVADRVGAIELEVS